MECQRNQTRDFDKDSKMHTYVVKHDICENWSLYLKQIIEHIFNHVLEKKYRVAYHIQRRHLNSSKIINYYTQYSSKYKRESLQ